MNRAPHRILALAVLGLVLARPGAAESGAPLPVVESVGPAGYRVRVPTGEAEVIRGDVLGHAFAEILIPGAEPSASAPELPPLPARTVLLRAPWGVRATVTSAPGGARSLGILRPAPVPRLLTDARARARATPEVLERAMRGPESSMGNRFRAAAPLHVVTETAVGGERILAVTVRPVSWDPLTSEARVVEEVVLEVRWDRSTEPLTAPEAVRSGGSRSRLRASLAPATTMGPAYVLRGSLAAVSRQRVDPSRPWVALGVTRPGLYQLGAADLAGAGVGAGTIDPATIRIFRATPGEIPESVDVDLGPDSLRECAIEVTGAGDGTLDPADRVFFYATGATGFGHDLARGKGPEYEEPDHSNVETLWLTWGPGSWIAPPRRMASRDAAPVTPGAPVLLFVSHRLHFETNRIPDFNKLRPPLRWERWFDRLLVQGSRVSFELRPPGAEPGTAADVRVRMWGTSASPGTGVPDHVVRIYWNRALVDTAGWELLEPQDVTASGFAVRALDSLEIEIPVLADPGPFPNRLDQSYLAWFEVGYQRRLAAANDTLQFAAPDSIAPGRVQYAITAVGDSAAARLLDRTDPENPVRLVNGAWSGASPAFAVTVEDSVGGERRRYTLVSTTRAPRPASIALFAPLSSPHTVADLADTTNGADYIIVTPPAFVAQAETLALYRSAFLSGVPAPRVRIATTDRIFAQFGSGRPSPVAIRNFVQYAFRHWTDPAPSYLCLLGDATYDPKNHIGFGVPDLLPTYSRYFDSGVAPDGEQYVSDDFYGFLDGPGDILLDLVVGRLPAGNTAQATSLVSGKLRAFEGNREFDMWRARAILAADDANVRERPDALGNQHVAQMERKDTLALPKPVDRQKIYLNDFAFADTTRQSKPAAREEFIAQVNRGAWLTDYIGHGSEDVLADEQLFRSIDVPRLVNAARPTILGTFSCTVGKFDEPGSDGLGERLLELPQGGTVVSIAATAEAFGGASTLLNDDFLKYQFPLTPRVDSLVTSGLALALGKNENASPIELSSRKYAFLGDPGVVPPMPRGRGVWEKGPLDSVARGEVAVLRGHALAAGGTLPDTLSTGVADVLIQGPPIRRTQVANGFPFDYFVPGYTLFRGLVPVDRGSFEVRFVVPTDARVVGAGGRLRALLSEAGGLGAGLAMDSIRVASSAPTRVDVEPPTIRLRYPSASDSTFRPGDRLTIEIADSSGIDLTRIDNAHSIFIIIDDRGTPYEITGQFAYETGSFTQGSVDFVIPDLADGPHRLEVHASDTFRNIAVQNFIVDVARSTSSGSALVMDQVFNYPNPFPQETYLHARLSQPARIRIKILTVAGRRVREIDLDGKAGENYIPWDGRDSAGEKVAIGVYLFHVTAESPSGGRVTAVGRALRTN